jgi:hypothetical protein
MQSHDWPRYFRKSVSLRQDCKGRECLVTTTPLGISEVAFFSREEIPDILSGERTLPRHITDAFAALENPDCPTVFD